MSGQSGQVETQPLVDDSITAEDTGFSSSVNKDLSETGTQPQASDSSLQGEEQAELQDQIEEAVSNGASKEEVKNMTKEFVLKVNGKELKKKIDLSDEEAIKRELQLAAAGREAMQKSKELEKIFEQELIRLRDNPWDVLKEMGHDPEKMAEDLLRKQVDEYKKSPEQRKQEQLQKELESARKEAERLKKEAHDAKMAQLTKEASMRLNKEIIDALDAHKTLPKNERTVARIAEAMEWAEDNGYEGLEVKDIIPAVEAQIRQEIRQFLDDAPESMFEEYVGKQNLERVRKSRLASAKKAPTTQEVKPTAASVETKKTEGVSKVNAKDFFRNLR